MTMTEFKRLVVEKTLYNVDGNDDRIDEYVVVKKTPKVAVVRKVYESFLGYEKRLFLEKDWEWKAYFFTKRIDALKLQKKWLENDIKNNAEEGRMLKSQLKKCLKELQA